MTTPVHNGEAFLRRCYATLLRQTFEDWEWVVVDDGSTDRTWEILEEMARESARIRIFRHENRRGRAVARTKLLSEARGPWMVVWDVDDLSFPRRLEEVMKAVEGGYEWFCSYVAVADAELRILGVRDFHRPWGLLRRRLFTHPSLACRTDLARKIGYDTELSTIGQIGEDKGLIYTLAVHHDGLRHRAPLVLHQPSPSFLRRAIQSNQVRLRTVRAMHREGSLFARRRSYLTAQSLTLVKLGALNLLRVWPPLYQWILRRRLLGPAVPSYELSGEERAFLEEMVELYGAPSGPERDGALVNGLVSAEGEHL